MSDFEGRLGRSLEALEPIPAVSEQQWRQTPNGWAEGEVLLGTADWPERISTFDAVGTLILAQELY